MMAWAGKAVGAQERRDSLARVASHLHQKGLTRAWNGWREGIAVLAERRLALAKVRQSMTEKDNWLVFAGCPHAYEQHSQQ